MDAAELVRELGGTWNGSNGKARCPAHHDRKPSLSVTEGKGGKILVKCHAGCSQEAVIAELRMRGLWPSQTKHRHQEKFFSENEHDEEEERIRRARGFFMGHKPVAGTPGETYLEYRGLDVKIPETIACQLKVDETQKGKPIPAMVVPILSHDGDFIGAHVTRLKPSGRGKSTKKNAKRTYGVLKGRGGAIRLHPAATKMAIAEGIETALAVHQITGLPVWAGISASNMKNVVFPPEVKKVIIAADNDKVGREAAEALGNRLAREGRTVRVAVPKGKGKDWLDKLNDPNADLTVLKRKLLKARRIRAPKGQGLRAVTRDELRRLELPPRQNLLDPWLPAQGLAMIHAPRGVGKTYVALGIAHAVTSGDSFLGWSAKCPGEVLYLDGELPANLLQQRVREFDGIFPGDPEFLLRFVTPDLQDGPMPDLSTAEGQAAVDKLVTAETRLIIVDSLSTLVRSGDESLAESWSSVQEWALRHRAGGRSVLFIHHSGKSGRQRGTSKREDVLDTVINLERPPNYTPEEGATFEVRFEKSRGIYGDDVRPFEAQLSFDKAGRMRWTTEKIVDNTYGRIVDMVKEGKKQREIAVEIKISQARVSQCVKQARENGDLPPRSSKTKRRNGKTEKAAA